MEATSDPRSRHHCSGDARLTVGAAFVVWASRSLRGRPDSRNLKRAHFPICTVYEAVTAPRVKRWTDFKLRLDELEGVDLRRQQAIVWNAPASARNWPSRPNDESSSA